MLTLTVMVRLKCADLSTQNPGMYITLPLKERRQAMLVTQSETHDSRQAADFGRGIMQKRKLACLVCRDGLTPLLVSSGGIRATAP